MTDKTKRCPNCGCEHDGSVLQCDCGENLSGDNNPENRKRRKRTVVFRSIVVACLLIVSPLLWQYIVFSGMPDTAQLGFLDFLRIRYVMVIQRNVRTPVESIRRDGDVLIVALRRSSPSTEAKFDPMKMRDEVTAVVFKLVNGRWEWVQTSHQLRFD